MSRIPFLLGKPDRKAWLLRVARLAERDQSSWVVLARNPQARGDRKSLDRLSETAPVDAEVVPLLLSLAIDLGRLGGDRISLMTRVQEAHPADVWANSFLVNDLLAAEHYQEDLGLGDVYASSARHDEASAEFQRCLTLDPGKKIETRVRKTFLRPGRHDEAHEAWAASIRADPQNQDVRDG